MVPGHMAVSKFGSFVTHLPPHPLAKRVLEFLQPHAGVRLLMCPARVRQKGALSVSIHSSKKAVW